MKSYNAPRKIWLPVKIAKSSFWAKHDGWIEYIRTDTIKKRKQLPNDKLIV